MKTLTAKTWTKPAQKYLVVFLLAVVFCLFLLPSLVDAQETGPGIFSCATSPIDCTIYYIKGFIAYFIALVGSGIDAAIRAPIAGVPVVISSWGIVRGFANMFFILALIIMAFATIFSVSKYDFRTLIARFLIAALLINFSLVIGEIIIDWSTSLSNVFLDAIGSVGDRLAQGADLGQRFDSSRAVASSNIVDGISWTQTMISMLDIVMLSIILFSLAVLLFFSIIRIPILWALLIVSPIAWITYILPTTMGINRRWWKYFIGWNVFMPIYLFFIYFGVLFLGNKQQVLAGNAGPLISGFNTTFQDIFFYILIGIFLIGGAKVAMSAGMAAGAGGVAAGIWAKGRTTARFARSNIPFVSRYGRALSSGAKERLGQIQREGIQTPGFRWMYGGAEGEERTKAMVAERFGVRDARDKQFAKDVELSKGRQFNRMRVEQLEEYVANNKGKVPEREYVAALETLRERRGLDGQQYLDLYNTYGREKSENARKLLERIDIKSLSREGRRLLADPKNISDVKFQQKIADVRAETKDFANLEEWQKALTLFTFEGDRIDYIKKSKDFLESQSEKDRLDAFKKFQTDYKDDMGSQREFAMLMANKGDFDQDGAKRLVGPNGIFETDNDKYRFLDALEKKKLLTALRIKADPGIAGSDGRSLLRDVKGEVTDFASALEFKAGRISNDDILEQSPKEIEALIEALSQRDPNTGKETDKGRQAIGRVFTPSRIRALNLNPKSTGAKIQAMSSLFEIGRKEGLIKEKVEPLKLLLEQIGIRCAEAMTIPAGIADRPKAERILERINKLMGTADKQFKTLQGNQLADDAIVDDVQKIYASTQGLVNQVRNKYK